jgi:hypothetical protein
MKIKAIALITVAAAIAFAQVQPNFEYLTRQLDDLKSSTVAAIQRINIERAVWRMLAESEGWTAIIYKDKDVWCASATNQKTGARINHTVVLDADRKAGKSCPK